MATITSNTFLDDGVARTAGEVWTCNGGNLTIRTDSRWHSDAPAGRLGSLGALTISPTLGGGYYIDATQVRWMAYTAGSGTVPAIGTTVSNGGVSGYFLGAWASLSAAPTAVGAAMPATGFLKFREVTGGPFSAGALTGISATGTVDVAVWIEVVHDQAIAITVPRLGRFQTRGDWFYLSDTSGASNQVIQTPTNGSATAYVPGVWIETGVGTGLYDYYPSLFAAGMISANLGTDARAKFVLMGTNGTVTIGHNGTIAIGYVPPSGCKVRIPNILGRQCATGSRSVNIIPSATAATRPDFTTTSAGAIDIQHFATDWYLNFAQPYSVRVHDTSTFDYLLMSEVATPLDIDNVGTSTSQSIDQRTFNATSCFAGGTVKNSDFQRFSAGTTDHSFEIIYCNDIKVENVRSGIIAFTRSTGMCFQATQSTGLEFKNCHGLNSGIQLTTCADSKITNYDHTDRYVGATTTAGIYAIYILASCVGVIVDGVTFGYNDEFSNVHPYLGIVNYGQSTDLKFRNFGSRSTFLSGGSTNFPAYIFASAGNNASVKMQRCYLAPTRTGAVLTNNADSGYVYEHVYGDFADTMTLVSLNSVGKNLGGTHTTAGQASVYGLHFFDAFTSNTVGRITLAMNEPTAATTPFVTVVSGNPKFTSAGGITMEQIGDEVIWEQSYFALAITGFAGSVPVITGTNVTVGTGPVWGNHDIYFQYDVGNGFNGSWIDFNGSELGAVTGFDPAKGVKLKIRVVCNTANATNLISYIRATTESTLAAQIANLYPLDVTILNVTGLKPGSEVRVYEAGTTIEVGGVENSGTSQAIELTSPLVDIVIHALSYEYLKILDIDTSVNTTVPVQQRFDRQY
jgi:hypothetical protein